MQLKLWLASWLEQCLMRRAPQDDPLSVAALLLSLSAYLLVDLLQAGASSAWAVSLGMTILDTLVMVLFAWVVLLITNKSPRFFQTLTSLAGTGVILGLVGLPLVQLAARTEGGDDPAGALVLAWLVLLGWSIAVQAHIFRHALSTGFGTGVVLAIIHTVLVVGLLDTFFPRVTAG